MKIRIGSRESKLAVIQAEMLRTALLYLDATLEIDIITMKTTGDLILDRCLDKIGGKGLFVKELDQALLAGIVDLTVHSMKDMPMELHEELPILAVSKREDPRDVLVLPKGHTVLNLDGPVGCSSARRTLQFQQLPEACAVKPVRGNVITRLEKLDRGDYTGLMLAAAGLKRLQLEERISRFFSTEEILPAACQGVLAVQGRKDFAKNLLAAFHDPQTFSVALAERSFVRRLDGGCSSPVAAYGELFDDKLKLTGIYVNASGKLFRGSISGKASLGETLGKSLADQLKKEGDKHEESC